MPLNFQTLRTVNVKRSEEVFCSMGDWSPTDWACALAGEAGEACNKIKKMRRGEAILTVDIAEELADVVIYTDLLAARLNINLEIAVLTKFNKVSRKRGSTYFL